MGSYSSVFETVGGGDFAENLLRESVDIPSDIATILSEGMWELP